MEGKQRKTVWIGQWMMGGEGGWEEKQLWGGSGGGMRLQPGLLCLMVRPSTFCLEKSLKQSGWPFLNIGGATFALPYGPVSLSRSWKSLKQSRCRYALPYSPSFSSWKSLRQSGWPFLSSWKLNVGQWGCNLGSSALWSVHIFALKKTLNNQGGLWTMRLQPGLCLVVRPSRLEKVSKWPFCSDLYL